MHFFSRDSPVLYIRRNSKNNNYTTSALGKLDNQCRIRGKIRQVHRWLNDKGGFNCHKEVISVIEEKRVRSLGLGILATIFN